MTTIDLNNIQAAKIVDARHGLPRPAAGGQEEHCHR
jgi:hypothetical protein